MNRMKRWTMSVTSWVDGMLAQVENHEAAVSSAIGRVRQSSARARVQLKRVERDQRALRDTLLREEEAVGTWRRRAKTAGDEAIALECLRRHKAAERRVPPIAATTDRARARSQGAERGRPGLERASVRAHRTQERDAHAPVSSGSRSRNGKRDRTDRRPRRCVRALGSASRRDRDRIGMRGADRCLRGRARSGRRERRPSPRARRATG